MNFIWVNIGNTHTVFCKKEGSSWTRFAQYDTSSLKIEHFKIPAHYIVSSVVPEKNKLLPSQSFFINSHCQLPFMADSKMDLSTLGADRIANLAGLKSLYNDSVLSIDFGSCITFEWLDEKGEWSGGAIIPGRSLSRKALSFYTAQLPCIPLQKEWNHCMGENTMNAILLGIDYGLSGNINHLISFFQSHLSNPQKLKIVLTGGDVHFFDPLINYAHSIDHDLIFKGMLEIMKLNHHHLTD